MEKHGVKNMVFSSSATVYGEPETTPVRESARLGPVTNPYGKTKLFIEEILRDQCNADSDWNVCLLRYVQFSLLGMSRSQVRLDADYQ